MGQPAEAVLGRSANNTAANNSRCMATLPGDRGWDRNPSSSKYLEQNENEIKRRRHE
jgi:hypothetical protein